jgi:hypothetical protein
MFRLRYLILMRRALVFRAEQALVLEAPSCRGMMTRADMVSGNDRRLSALGKHTMMRGKVISNGSCGSIKAALTGLMEAERYG